MRSGLTNLYINGGGESFSYVPVNSRGGAENLPVRNNRNAHAERLEKEFNAAWERAEVDKRETVAIAVTDRYGVYLEIKGQAGCDLLTKSLEDVRQHVRLCNIKHDIDSNGESTISTTVYVPHTKKDFFIKKINKYRESSDSVRVISSIESINLALVDNLWTSDIDKIPTTEPEWCEVWLMYEAGESVQCIIDFFFEICKSNDIEHKEQAVIFPERIVVGVKTNKKQLSDLQWLSSRIAELRIMTRSAGYFCSLSVPEQRELAQKFKERLDISSRSDTSVCILDTGVNNGHPMLEQLLADKDMHTIDLVKGVTDNDGHGTEMSGIAAFFNLEDRIDNNYPIVVNHFLESVKLFDKGDDNKQELYGCITADAISLAEIQNPSTNRAICMAVTAYSNALGNDGRPSSWSGAIDAVVAGVNDIESASLEKKLVFVSAGNTSDCDIKEAKDFKTAIINHTIEDPAQAWNAITVGAYTNKYQVFEKLNDPYQIVAEPGCFSPFTSSSLHFSDKWPIKPDILLEGGNLLYDKNNDFYSEHPDLSLLTTCKDFYLGKSFDTISMTSSATAQAAWLGAQIWHQYPSLWPETIRALIIHSSDWTEVMKKNIFEHKDTKRADYRNLLRICGYGVPDLNRALWSASNRVNLVIEDEIQPFYKKGNATPVSKEMHIHDIPWPNDVLLDLGSELVRMRVTLSYFIEPGPGEIGWKDKYKYPSCGLVFDVNNPTESSQEFLKRINKAIKDGDENKSVVKNDSTRWIIGSNNRNTGSIHSDIWEGTASELSQSNKIAIYPKTGWWKLRTNLMKYNSKVRYSLVVSIETPKADIDIYSVIKNKIESKIKIDNRVLVTTEV